jgi:hypothetical protein
MANVRLTIEGREVVASGTLVFGRDDKRATITLDDLNFEIVFVEGSESSPTVAPQKAGDKGLLLEFKSWNATNTNYTANVGTLTDRRLKIAVDVTTVKNDDVITRSLHYLFTLEK